MKLNKNFSLLLVGQSLANIGDVLYIVSIISMIFTFTGSATAASFVPFTITSSMFVSSFLTPLLIGKVNLKWLLAGSQLGKTFLMILLGMMLLVISASDYYFLFIIIALIAFLDGCANPIRQTLIPHYVKAEELLQANGISETVTQSIQTVMWFVGSLFLLFMSSQQIIWVVGGLFAIAGFLLCFLGNVTRKSVKGQGKIEQVKEGWETLWRTPVLRKIALIDSLETTAGTVWIAAILYVFVSEALQVGEKWWGFINGSFFLGLIIGSIYCVKYSKKLEERLGTVILFGSFAGVIVTVLFSMTSSPYIALLLSLCVGVFGQIKNIPQQAVIQSSVPKADLPTVYTSLGAIGTGIFGVSSLLMGVLADLFEVRVVFLVSGLMLALVSLIIYRSKHLFVRKIIE